MAFADDYSPTAAEDTGGSLTVFFADAGQRDRAREAFAHAFPSAHLAARDVDDGDWARRSQENLGPVVVGRITVVPPWWTEPASHDAPRAVADPSPLVSTPSGSLSPLRLVIRPSMAFGTGHHATTRLCLAALQLMELSNRFVLDVGTGSGVLAIAARGLGAREALGIDNDPDAIACANDNLSLNDCRGVTFEAADIGESAATSSPARRPFAPKELAADIITANLTGALLRRSAARLMDSLAPGGTVIVSGILKDERDEVLAAFGNTHLVWEGREDEWVALAIRRRTD